MDLVTTQTYLGDILRIVSDSLLGPDIVLLLGFIVYAVFCIGSIIVETVTEHRNFKVQMPKFLAELADAGQQDMPEVIERSGLLNRQKIALLTVFDYRTLPGDMLVALVKRLLNEEDTHYQRIVNRNNVAVRVAPMLGLMGTLIPLGPGIAALGQGDVASLSSSLVIAFNTTVAGLAAAAVCLVISRIRRTWYNTYMNALESAMASMLYKIGLMQDAGEISVERPSDHAVLFQKALKRKSVKQQSKPSANPAKPKPFDKKELREDLVEDDVKEDRGNANTSSLNGVKTPNVQPHDDANRFSSDAAFNGQGREKQSFASQQAALTGGTSAASEIHHETQTAGKASTSSMTTDQLIESLVSAPVSSTSDLWPGMESSAISQAQTPIVQETAVQTATARASATQVPSSQSAVNKATATQMPTMQYALQTAAQQPARQSQQANQLAWQNTQPYQQATAQFQQQQFLQQPQQLHQQPYQQLQQPPRQPQQQQFWQSQQLQQSASGERKPSATSSWYGSRSATSPSQDTPVQGTVEPQDGTK